MTLAVASPPNYETFADLLEALGGIPPWRIRLKPAPGTATVADVLEIHAREKRLCELVDGVLVEKPMGFHESRVASVLGHFIETYLDQNNIGITAGEAGMLRLEGQVRMPDLLFMNWNRLPGRECPKEQVPAMAPDLAVEVLSESNTRAEMERKRREYFAAGTQLVWEVDPDARTVDVYIDSDTFTRLTETDTLGGGAVLPGFTLSIRRWFERVNRGA
jgi:Uma2 family endonuclease